MTDAPWYEPGVRFECTMCGRCCSGPPGFVLFTDEEARRIAHRLNITPAEFLERYTEDTRMKISGRRRSLREVETEHGLDCVFLDRRSVPGKALCTIHEVRPLQCRTFPFWPEHVQSRRAWDSLAQTCEGIGRGPVVPFTEIRVQVEAHRRDRHGG